MRTAEKPRGRPFQPGTSGNPEGRHKDISNIRDLARQYSDRAINTIVHVMEHDTNGRARVAAATAILDRAWGKAPHEIQIWQMLQNEIAQMSDEALIAEFERIMARRKEVTSSR
jgi:hypothetical protein